MRISSLLLLALVLNACSKDKPDEPSAAELATFIADPVSGEADESATKSTFAALASERLVHFTVCLKDAAALAPVVGFPFRIRKGTEELKLRQPNTDQSGCLHWSERYQFSPTQQEAFLEEERTIEAVAQHQGQVTVRVGVNPWRKGSAAVRDLSTKDAPLTRKHGESAEATASLAVDGVETLLEIVKSSGPTPAARLRVTFEPKLRRLGLNGAPVFEPLTSGNFDLSARVIAVGAGGEFPFTSVLNAQGVGFNQGSVRAEAKVEILRKLNRREMSLELEFTATPVDAAGLKAVHGRVPLGRMSSLSLSGKGPLKERPLNLAGVQAPSTAPASAGDAAPAASIELGRVSAKEVVVKQLDSSGRPRVIEVEFRAAVRNGISQEPVLAQKFKITDAQGEQEVLSDEEDGTLKWKQCYEFDFFAKQEPVRKEFRVTPVDGYYGSRPVRRAVWLNFWEFESPGQVAIDEEKDGAPSPSVASQGGAAELTISSSFFAFVERSFQVDEHLNLTTTRKYRVELAPEIRRLSRTKGWLSPQGLGNGRFQVRFLLETNDRDNPEVIDAQTLELESRNGKINAAVEFHFPDVRYVASRASLSIQVLPLDRSTSLVSAPYEGTFEMGGAPVRMEARASEITARMALAPKANGLLRVPATELFVRTNKHEKLDAARLAALGIKEPELARYASSGIKSGLAGLCSLFFEESSFNPFSQSKRCQRDPSSWLSFVNTLHVRKVYRAEQSGSVEPSSISLSAGVSQGASESRGESRSSSDSVSATANVQGSVPLLNLVGLNIGVGFGYGHSVTFSKSYSRDRSQGKNRSYGESKSLSVDEVQMAVDADLDQCAIVTALDAPAEKRRAYMFCVEKPVRKKFTEHYYYVAQGSSNNPVSDEGVALKERPLTALVRGKARYEQFKKLLQDPQVTLNLETSLPLPHDLWKEAERRYDGYFPGLLTP